MIKITGTMQGDGYERGHFYIREDGKEIFSSHNLSDCPEDAILARDIPSWEVFDLIKKFYKLGKDGEEVEFVNDLPEDEDEE